jgi:hypothetical protein
MLQQRRLPPNLLSVDVALLDAELPPLLKKELRLRPPLDSSSFSSTRENGAAMQCAGRY